jgi:putative hemolysin
MSQADVAMLVAVIAIWVLQGFLALSETSLTSSNRVKAMALVEEKRHGAEALLRLVEHPERFLTALLLIILVCQIVSASLLGIVADHLFGSAGVVAVIVVQVLFIFVFVESGPKTWAVQHADRAALLTAPIVAAITGFAPVRWLANGLIWFTNVVLPGKGLKQGPYVSEEELLATVDVALEDDVIEHEERALIHSIIEFGDTVAREVMVPRPDMVAVEGRDRLADVLEVAISAGYSRIPVYEQGIDDIVGIVYTKDLMRAVQAEEGESPVRELVREARFTPETKRVAELMREMQKEKFHIAIVVDEYGGTAGLVTLEDLIEELVGEIVDEFDVEEPLIEALSTGEYRVHARMAVDEVNELLHAELPEGDWDSIGGLVFNALGHVPSEGEAVHVDGFRLTAEKVQGRRIGRVRITRLPDVGQDAA